MSSKHSFYLFVTADGEAMQLISDANPFLTIEFRALLAATKTKVYKFRDSAFYELEDYRRFALVPMLANEESTDV